MTEALLLGLANFVFIWLKAWQQRNVAFLQYTKVPFGSFGLATTEVYIIHEVAQGASWLDIFALGSAGALGCMAAMWYSRHYNG